MNVGQSKDELHIKKMRVEIMNKKYFNVSIQPKPYALPVFKMLRYKDNFAWYYLW